MLLVDVCCLLLLLESQHARSRLIHLRHGCRLDLFRLLLLFHRHLLLSAWSLDVNGLVDLIVAEIVSVCVLLVDGSSSSLCCDTRVWIGSCVLALLRRLV